MDEFRNPRLALLSLRQDIREATKSEICEKTEREETLLNWCEATYLLSKFCYGCQNVLIHQGIRVIIYLIQNWQNLWKLCSLNHVRLSSKLTSLRAINKHNSLLTTFVVCLHTSFAGVVYIVLYLFQPFHRRLACFQYHIFLYMLLSGCLVCC